MEEVERDIHWSNPLEELIASEGEKCRGLAWINQQAEAHYTKRSNLIAIPVIILSTLAGTASVGSSSLFAGETQISSIAIGLVSIGVGILNTISSYFAFARKAESHRIAYLQYSKLFSIIRVEMSLPRNERQQPEVLLKQIRDGMERLAETTPSPPPPILREFNNHFKDEDKTISRPVEVNGLQKIYIFRNQLSSPDKNITIQIDEGFSNTTISNKYWDKRPGSTSVQNQGSLSGGTAGKENQGDSETTRSPHPDSTGKDTQNQPVS